MLRDFTRREKYEEAMLDEHPLWSHPLMIPLLCLWFHSITCTVSFGKGGSFEIGRQRSRGGRISDVDGQGMWGLKNWTIFMDVIMCIIPNCCCLKVLPKPTGHVATSLLFFKVEIMRSRGCPVMLVYANWKVIE